MTVEVSNDSPIARDPISRALHNLTDLGIVTTDMELRVTGWNRWMEIHTGKASIEVIGHLLTDLYPELKERRHDQHYRQALLGRVVVLAQRFHKHLIPMPAGNGNVLVPMMQQSARIAPLTEGETTFGTLTIIEDVSERVNYDVQLAKHAGRQLAISTLSQTALRGASITQVFDEACRLTASTLGVDLAAMFERKSPVGPIRLKSGFGYPSGDIGREVPDPPPHWHIAKALSSDQQVEVFGDELRAATLAGLPDREIKSGLCIALPGVGIPTAVLAVYTTIPRHFDDDEIEFLRAISGIAGVAQDRHRLLQELQAKIKDLALSDQRKDEFLAMLGHELRNPLAPIANATELLRKESTGEATRQWATGVIERQLLQITRLVDDLLDVARITRGKVKLRKTTVDIASIITRALETNAPLVEARRHHLHVSLPTTPLLIECDSERIAQVVANLLNNAAKYTEDGGNIWLTVERQKDELVISVKDSGVGISEEMIPSIFDLFTQVNPSLERKEGGLGIGLTLVKSLVALHGGGVSVRSEGANQGSEFIVRLPLSDCPGEVKLEEQRPVPESRNTQTAHKVLIVDDNQDAADLLKLLLETLGYDVRCAYEGPQALVEAEHFQPDLVILDIGLPGMTGYKVAEHLRAAHGDKVKLVALTGYGQDEDRRRSKETGFDHHLVKPISAAEIDALFARLRAGNP